LPTATNGPPEGNWEAIPQPLGTIGRDRPQNPHFVDVAYIDVVDRRPLPLRVSDFRLYDIKLGFTKQMDIRSFQAPMYSLMKELPKIIWHRDDLILQSVPIYVI
jgi:hypothetical protein